MQSVENLLNTTTAKGKAQKVRKAAERHSKFKHAEALLPADRRLLARDDIDIRARKEKADTTLAAYMVVIESFVDFTEKILHASVGHAKHGLNYFRQDGPMPTSETIRLWLTWFAESATGTLDGARLRSAESDANLPITVATAKHTFNVFSGALLYFNRALDRQLRTETKDLIDVHLKVDQKLNPHMKIKPIVYTHDMRTLIFELWQQIHF